MGRTLVGSGEYDKHLGEDARPVVVRELCQRVAGKQIFLAVLLDKGIMFRH